jgi:beta-lactamase class A
LLTRRTWLYASFAYLAIAKQSPKWSTLPEALARLEPLTGGRLGVAVLDTSTNSTAGHRSQERFPMCSTFKLLAVGAVLLHVDQHKEQLDRIIRFTQKELIPYSPATEKRVGAAGMSIRELCAAAITLSDNTAANLLLSSLGGPAAVTAFARALGDQTTRLDRNEPDLNEAVPGDPRDTTSPEAMLSNLRALVLGNALSSASCAQLSQWLIENKTGDKRLRAGVTSAWKVGDKTGSGKEGTANDVAILWPPLRLPILTSVYLTGATIDDDHRNAVIASVGELVSAAISQ